MLEGRTYVPLLHARLAEMRALRELATSTKNVILPVIRIRPWLNAKNLSKAFDVIEEAFGDRAFGLDLDSTKFDPSNQKPAYQEFAALFNEADGFSNYYDCVAEKVNRVPVIRRPEGVTPFLDRQLESAKELERGLVVRVFPDQLGDYIQVAAACAEKRLENVVFVVDCGWRMDILTQAAQCTSIVNNILDVSEDIEVVVAGSSFPNAFAGMGERGSFQVNERLLFQNVRQNINRGLLVYGDWGSTRPPTDPVPMTNVPRIDTADNTIWMSWRSEAGETYEKVAERVVADPLWTGNTDLWGNYLIESTAEGLEPAIKAPAMAAAVRVNLHMHTQAHFDNPNNLNIGDEPVGDDL